jgi:hypothetical protein
MVWTHFKRRKQIEMENGAVFNFYDDHLAGTVMIKESMEI